MGKSHAQPFDEEKKTYRQIKNKLDAFYAKVYNMPRYHGEDFTEQVLEDVRERKRRNLAKAILDPYFGRLDFREDSESFPARLYIGKTGVYDEDTGKLLIIDWRAPVSSLFYSFTGEEQAFYEAPEGTVSGDIHLKRNIVIRNNELERVVDSYVLGQKSTAGADEFLLYKLEENKDNRLRDIVSTIQAEQNKIIRYPRQTALFIQGVAGSGKTTVALHRLAYLLYHYRETIQADKMVIFAPSRMFLDYISGVLPELGVGDIRQTTFTTWALQLLQDDYELIDESEDLQIWFDDRYNRDKELIRSARYKGSVKFQRLLDYYLKAFEHFSTPTEPFTAWPGQILEAAVLRKWYLQDYHAYPLFVRRNKILERIKRWIETVVEEKPEHEQKELKKQANLNLRTYSKTWLDLNLYELYQMLFATEKKTVRHAAASRAAKKCKEVLSEPLQKNTRVYLNNLRIKTEDIPPLLYMSLHLNGHNRDDELEHVVIDEAQDITPLQIEAIKKVTKGTSFTILGDLAQGIHTYRGISAWHELQSLFAHEQSHYHELQQSYRSTMEIIEFANLIISQANLPVPQAIPVFRSGKPVLVENTQPDTHDSQLVNYIRALGKHIHTLAVIGRTTQECQHILNLLQQNGIDAEIIGHDQQEYRGGISVIPVYLTKGLEFDAVILYNVDDKAYRDTRQDIKLLYVGCTRALHDLYVLYKETPSALLVRAIRQ